MKIIVLSKAEYKEKDLILSAISETGFTSFRVRGGTTPNGPFTWLCNPLTVAEVELIDNPRYTNKIIKGAQLISTPLSNGDSLNNLLAINLLQEVMLKMFADEDKHLMFKDIEDFFVANKGNQDLILSEIIFLLKALKLNGAGLEVDKCIGCGSKKDIVAFSFAEGGFLCRECLSEDIQIDLSPNQMKTIRYLVKHNYQDLIKDQVNEHVSNDDKKYLLNKVAMFAYDIIGAKLNSIDLILKSK